MISIESGFASIEVLVVLIVAALAISMAYLLAAPLGLLKSRASASATWQRAPNHSETHTPLPRSQIDIREFLRQESMSLDARLRSVDMSLQLELAANPLPVLLDRSRMREVLAQVVDLAGGVMSRGSTLQVLARIDGTHAVVNFMDVPSGADAPRLGRWFDEVYAHSLRSKHDNDAAARVAECGQIVGEHHGRIYAAPSPLGSLGITLRLPMLRI